MKEASPYRRNERDWAGQLVSWLKSAIEKGTTQFQDATNDTGVKMPSGRTKFPDILLFSDRVSGVVFNGWELKFPDTPADDPAMLDNALEKAKKLRSGSFVTWNGSEAVIWGIDTSRYTRDSLTKLKVYPPIRSVSNRNDLADPANYSFHEASLKQRALDILHDLDMLCRQGRLKPSINISGNILEAIYNAGNLILPQFQLSVEKEKGVNKEFRAAFGRWKILESSTIKIFETSSRRKEKITPEQVLAKFAFYNLIGKILFYLTLSENLSGELEPITINEEQNVKEQLNRYFEQAKAIDYQAIFKPYFTDSIEYSPTTDEALKKLLGVLGEFDFKILPTGVIGHILEHLVPNDERKKLGQYFTPETLSNMVAFPAVRTRNDILFDPTCGTGTFLVSFYRILNFLGEKDHTTLLSQIWGNDISHFPAILSVINLYRQDLGATENFPRVMRDDYFHIETSQAVVFPNPHNYREHTGLPIPLFDGIAGNFPFIQQEDIPNKHLTAFFRSKFKTSQRAFLADKSFKINERSDYFTYCVYQSTRFLKPDGVLSVVTSNAWMGKEYGMQFKQFLLDNYHIKYIVRSSAEHWFKDSQVSTLFLVLERPSSEEPARFVTINRKLQDFFSQDDISLQLRQIEDFYSQIDHCDMTENRAWTKNGLSDELYERTDGSMSVCVIPKSVLAESIKTEQNWGEFFISKNLLAPFQTALTPYSPRITHVIRGERTG